MVAEILEDVEDVEISHDDIKERARIIEQTLADFGLPVRVVEANPGPGGDPIWLAARLSRATA